MTLGLYVPAINLDAHTESDNKEVEAPKKQADTNSSEQTYDHTTPLFDTVEIPESRPIDQIITQARHTTIEKLGPRILSKVDQEVQQEILPLMDHVVATLIEDYLLDDQDRILLIEQAIPGYGEKIFDLYHEGKDEIIAKFHVRRDNRPLEGYWFNFHYHTIEDHFETHYPIGEVYWSKNTPPKWMG